MRKHSAFLRSALAFTALYTVYFACFLAYDCNEAFKKQWVEWVTSTDTYSSVGQILLSQGSVSDLDVKLARAMSANEIHFYSIRRDGRDLIYANSAGADDQVQIANQPGTFETDRYRYTVVQSGDYQLAVGHKKAFSDYVMFHLTNHVPIMLFDIFMTVISAFSISLICFRDLRQILKRIATRGATRGDLSLAKSSETLTLVRGLSGFESQAETLKSEKDTFRSQVLPALRRELESGKKPPYEFACTLVRTDINNFTQTFMSEKRSDFMASINEFFVGVTHLVSRYNGSVYEFVGDEVLFYFKDEDHESSSATAIAALRDIHKLSLKLSEKTEEHGYSFKIKSSIAHGLLRFGPLVDAHALAGPPLIETVRMLAHVHEKSENTVLFDESMSDVVTDLCRSRRHQVVMLKGLSGARALVTLEAFTPLSLHLRQQDKKSLKLATYYRDDEDVCEILKFVTEQYGKVASTELNHLVSLFRQYTVAKTSPEVRRAYIDCLMTLSHAHDNNEKDVFLYASLVSAANHILTTTEWNGEVRNAMYGCLSHPNRRVVANALDIFATFEPEAGEKIFADLAKSGDNRIEANSLIKEAKRSWKKKTAQWLKTMLKAPTPYSKASALYALGEIAKHFKETDPVAFSSDADLQELLEMIPKLTDHANAMVRRQALSALGKAGLAAAAEASVKADASAVAQSNVVPLRKTS
jgi:class 3 adenylate cyclase